MKVTAIPFGFSDPFGDQWEISGINKINDYIYKLAGYSLVINPYSIEQRYIKKRFIIEGKIDIIGYLPDGKPIWFFPQ